LLQEETPEFIPPQLWPPNLPDTNTVDYSVLRVIQENVYKTRISDLNKLKQRLSTEWIKLPAAMTHDPA